MPLGAGSRFGPDEILSPIGTGGMGSVYRARDTKLNRDVAIKVLAGFWLSAIGSGPDNAQRPKPQA